MGHHRSGTERPFAGSNIRYGYFLLTDGRPAGRSNPPANEEVQSSASYCIMRIFRSDAQNEADAYEPKLFS